MGTWYILTGKQILEELQSSYSGLRDQQVASQQAKFGKNVLDEAKQKSKLLVFLSQFADLITLTLLITAAISEEKIIIATDQIPEDIKSAHHVKPVGEREFINNATRLADQLLDILG